MNIHKKISVLIIMSIVSLIATTLYSTIIIFQNHKDIRSKN